MMFREWIILFPCVCGRHRWQTAIAEDWTTPENRGRKFSSRECKRCGAFVRGPWVETKDEADVRRKERVVPIDRLLREAMGFR